MITKLIRAVAPVDNHEGARLRSVKKRLGLHDAVDLVRRYQEADRVVFRVDPRVDLRRESAAASVHPTISTLFWRWRYADARTQSNIG